MPCQAYLINNSIPLYPPGPALASPLFTEFKYSLRIQALYKKRNRRETAGPLFHTN